ncbi:hypothetical protein [Spirosoma lituiforme]
MNTQLTYNAANQLVRYTNNKDSTGGVVYENNRYAYSYYGPTTDSLSAKETFYYLPSDSTNVLVFSYRIVKGVSAGTFVTSYTLDEQNRPIRISQQDFAATIHQDYSYFTYVNDNITQVILHATGPTYPYQNIVVYPTVIYEYDDKPNPLYGLYFSPNQLLEPALLRIGGSYIADFDVIRQYSRNNITKITFLNSTAPPIEYAYQYNSQGLPVAITNKTSGQITTLTYESY